MHIPKTFQWLLHTFQESIQRRKKVVLLYVVRGLALSSKAYSKPSHSRTDWQY